VARIHARCGRAVVTRCAGAKNLVVVNRNDGRPNSGIVAILADVGRRRVRRTFAGRVRTVVAAHAISRDISVIEIGRDPGDCRMAVVAVVATRYMSTVFAGGRCAIVAGAASANYLRMVDRECRQPGIRRVTILADIRCLDVILALACRVDTVVAADAVARDIDMVEIRRQPACRRVAILAVVAAGNVGCILPGRDHAIVTGTAGADHLCVVNRIDRCPDIRIVAILANIRRLDVREIFAGRFDAIVTAEAVSGDADMIEVRR